MQKKLVKGTIHAKGVDITIYTEDFQNEFFSLTDIARYKSDEPFIVINSTFPTGFSALTPAARAV